VHEEIIVNFDLPFFLTIPEVNISVNSVDSCNLEIGFKIVTKFVTTKGFTISVNSTGGKLIKLGLSWVASVKNCRFLQKGYISGEAFVEVEEVFVPFNDPTLLFNVFDSVIPVVTASLCNYEVKWNGSLDIKLIVKKVSQEGFVLLLRSGKDIALNGLTIAWISTIHNAGRLELPLLSLNAFKYHDVKKSLESLIIEDILQEKTIKTINKGKEICFRKRIDFEKSFRLDEAIPNVLTFLSGMHVDKRFKTRIETRVEDVDHRGFFLIVKSWSNTSIYCSTVSWIATSNNDCKHIDGKFVVDDYNEKVVQQNESEQKGNIIQIELLKVVQEKEEKDVDFVESDDVFEEKEIDTCIGLLSESFTKDFFSKNAVIQK
jgi:hypothetical protein